MPALLEEPRGDRAAAQLVVAHQPAQERQVRGHPEHHGLVERPGEPGQGVLAGLAVGDQLGDHRVVAQPAPRRRPATPASTRIPGPTGAPARSTRPAWGRKPASASSAYSRTSTAWPRSTRSRLAQLELGAGGDLDLPAHQVDRGDRLGDRVLDLDPGVHLEEEERAVLVDQELGRAGADVADRLGQPQRGRAEGRAAARAAAGRGRLLEHLLVAPLHRAVALGQVDAVPVGVAQDLDLDVPRVLDVALEQHRVVAERRQGLAPGRLDRRRRARRARAPPACRARRRPRPP